jgi:CheY-like chemotaxis protein/signal transduction histidine kinase
VAVIPPTAPGSRIDALREWIAPYTGDPVRVWRHRLLANLLIGLSLLASIPYTVGMIAAVRGGDLTIIVVDTAAIGVLISMLVARRAPFALRAGLLVILPMLLGAFLLIRHGFATSGFVWLFVGPIFAALLLGVRTSLYTVGFLSLLLALIGTALAQGLLRWALHVPDELRGWLTTSSTLIPLSVLVSLSIGRIFDGLAAEAVARRAAEDKVEREHQLASIGLATSALAHDVNNLLQPMLSDLEFLRHDGTLSQEQQEQLDRLIEKAARARGIMRRSLRFAQPIGTSPEVLELMEVIPETVRSLQAVVPRQVTLTVSEVPPLRITAEPAAVQQLLLQLVTNAARDFQEAGRLQLLVRETLVDGRHLAAGAASTLRAGDGTVSLMVLHLDRESADEAERRAADCRPMTPNEAESAVDGWLHSMMATVDGMGGLVLLRHRDGAPGCLRILLPVSREVPAPMATGEWRTAAQPPAEPTVVPPAKPVVIVVDDEPLVLQATLRLLNRLGYDTIGITDPHMVVARVRELPTLPRLLLSDVSMPGLDGWALADQVRGAHPALPIVLMSGHMDGPGAEGFAHGPVDALLTKPFTSRELAGVLTAVLGSPDHQPA